MKYRIALATLLLALPATAQAHRAWLLPSATVLSGEESWVTVDAAVSNNLFYFDHVPLQTNSITVEKPDGSAAEVQNPHTGKYRSTFDVHIDQPGTWKIGSQRIGVAGSYMQNGERQRLPRGANPADLASLIPQGATEIELSESNSRNQIFVTLGAPTDTVLQASGKGLEMVPVTHPVDMVAGEEATLRFLVDGAPANGVKLTIIPGGSRYRDDPMQMDLVTDQAGEVKVTWPEAGMYWLEAETSDKKTTIPGATTRNLGYVSTLEVMLP